MLREGDLCKGGDKHAKGCPLTSAARCIECGGMFEFDDPDCLPNCPRCESTYSFIPRCSVCPVKELEMIRNGTWIGRLVNQVLELQNAIRHYRVGWDEVDTEEDILINILEQEQAKRQTEEAERRQQEADTKRRIDDMQRGRK